MLLKIGCKGNKKKRIPADMQTPITLYYLQLVWVNKCTFQLLLCCYWGLGSCLAVGVFAEQNKANNYNCEALSAGRDSSSMRVGSPVRR